jgi:hypothetical protein
VRPASRRAGPPAATGASRRKDARLELAELYERAVNHHSEFIQEPWIVPKSIPILYFGDLEGYRNSELKIVTVGLNPSHVEFAEDRFRVSGLTKCQLEESLCQYFKFRPYNRWFDQAFEKRLLQPLGASYYGQHYPGAIPSWWYPQSNIVLHTDIGTPLATKPTWSKLPNRTKKRLQATGFPLWRDLIHRIAPDLILISVAQEHLRLLDIFWHQLRFDGASPDRLDFRVSKFGGSKIIWGKANRRPFFYVSSEHRPLIAAAILRELQVHGRYPRRSIPSSWA